MIMMMEISIIFFCCVYLSFFCRDERQGSQAIMRVDTKTGDVLVKEVGLPFAPTGALYVVMMHTTT